MKFKILLILQCALLLNACASLTPQSVRQYPDKESQSCANFFSELDQIVSAAGVIDSEAVRIKNYPYLRVNRFLSDFSNDQMDAASFDSWIDHMQTLAEEGWQIELSNMPALDRKNISFQAAEINININETIRYCGNLLRTIDLDEENERLHLKTIAKVPDEYKTWQRVLGLYPLTAFVFRSGIDKWHEETKNSYGQPLEKLNVHGELLRYFPSLNSTPLSLQDVSQIIITSSQNALSIPVLSTINKQKLFQSYAPVFEIDTVTNDDRIGTVEWDPVQVSKIKININLASVYQHISYTRFEDHNLLQLNYTIWFPSRPKTSTFDLLGGQLDGITWRVTLLPSGKPLAFDTIHNCGCYHLFFPTRETITLPQTESLDEPIFIPQTLTINTTDRAIIRIRNGSHYIERVYYDKPISSKTNQYQLIESNVLRSLELNNGERRSLFGQDGIIHSSARNERYLFWPMGIPNPGAMRQWGHHATAFVGRRHFDDARLFEKYFSVR